MGIRKELGVNSITENVREMRLRWNRHVQRMEENNEVRAVVDIVVPGKRPRGIYIYIYIYIYMYIYIYIYIHIYIRAK